MGRFPVTPQKELALARRLSALGIHEEDLQEAFVRSRGPGGQNVNKVSSCVVLTHVPTGTTARGEESRSQGMNRYLVRVRLADLLDPAASERSETERKQKKKQKARRKRRRAARASP